MEIADGRNITRFAGNAKGTASRASVPLLSYAHNTNAMPSENASETQEELVKALIIKDVMASKPGTTAQDFTLGSKV